MDEFDRWERRFAGSDYLFGKAPNAFLARQRERLPKQGRALSVADGEGRNGVWLAEQGLDVTSIDFSPAAQRKAQDLAAQRAVTITTERVDLTTWTPPLDAYDVVVAIFAQPVPAETLFSCIRQAVKPGGLVLIEGYTPKQLEYKTGGPSDIARLYTRAMYTDGFAGFAVIDIAEYDAEINEGDGHGGLSALIDLIAMK